MRRDLRLAAVIALIPALIVSAYGFITAPSQAQEDAPELLELGKSLYDQHCASCHGFIGEGNDELEVPPLIGVGRAATDFMLQTGRMPATLTGELMYTQPVKFTQKEIAAMVDYVETLGPGGPDIPDIDIDRGDLSEGFDLFIENCAACHGTVGEGDAVTQNDFAPDLHHVEPTQIGEAVRFGPGPMPRFDELAFDDEQLNSLVLYAYSTRDLNNPGGNSLGYGGPVAEGFVAWFFGLAILLIVVRLAGKRG